MRTSLLCVRAYGLWPVVLRGDSRHPAFKSFILLLLAKHVPDYLRQLLAYHCAGYMLATPAGYFLIKILYYRIIPVRYDRRLIKRHPQIPVAIFVFTPVAMSPA